jgi:RHS repeat-associated protein
MTVTGQPTVTYTRDNANRLTQIQQGTDTVIFTYDNANRRSTTTLGNGILITYSYDNANQLVSIVYAKGQTTIGDLQYTYDNAGRRTMVSGSLAGSDLPTTVASAIYNANNQLTNWAGATLTYDLDGNQTSDGLNTYSWNARDQLASISGAVAATFGYDGTGRRRSKTIGAIQTAFLYDGQNFVQEISGGTPTSNLVSGGIDELLQRKDGSTTSFPLLNALGSVIGLTDTAGVLQSQYSFEPYGKATTSGAASNNVQRYTGREDDGTGLLFYRARYYAASAGRFISEDPIGWESGQTNNYGYVGGNPLTYRDPKGLAKWHGLGRSLDYLHFGIEELHLESECKCGYKMTMTVDVKYVGGDINAAAFGYGSEYEDNFDCPNAMAFEGPAYKVSAGIAAHRGFGFSFSVLGRATSPGHWEALEGWGGAAGIAMGCSKVSNERSFACE